MGLYANYDPCFKQKIPLKDYIKQKIKLLKRDFCLDLTSEEEQHFWDCKTESDVDHYAHDLIVNKL